MHDTPDQLSGSGDANRALRALSAATAEGYGYLDSPLPSESDERVASLVQRFAEGNDAFRNALRAALTLAQYDALVAFAVRMATLAVRERSTARLRLGLNAVALVGDAPTADWRETYTPLLALRNATWRIGADARGEFISAARLARGRTARSLIAAGSRSALMAGIEHLVMRLGAGVWKAVDAPDGFRYVPVQRVSRAEVDGLIRRVEQSRGGQARNDAEPPICE